jgi:LytS/YehU family sensor histidine kinase
MVPLDEELDHLNLYLEIEQARFESRLRVSFDIADDTRAALVPSLILQPLVENAIRHGVGKRAGPGEVVIRSARREDKLELGVIDNGLGLAASRAAAQQEPLREGVGLANVRGRLDHLYGRAHSLVLRSLAGGGVEARILMPFETAPPTQPKEEFEEVSHAAKP